MLLETVDASYWLVMSAVLSCICLVVAVLVVSSSSSAGGGGGGRGEGGGGQRCCRRKRFQDDVRCVADDQKKCGNDDEPTNAAAAVEGDNLDDYSLADIGLVTPMRPFSECHLRPYLYEPSYGEIPKKAIIVVCSFERDRNVVNTLTEQVHRSNFPVASADELPSKSVELKGSTAVHAIHVDQSSVRAADQIQSDLSTSPRDTYENCLDRREDSSIRATSGIYDDAVGCCMHASDGISSVRTYAKLKSSSTDFPSGTTTVVSYTSLKNQDTESSYLNASTTSDSRTLQLSNGDQNAYNCSLPSKFNLYNYTLHGDSTTKSDTPQAHAADDCIAIIRPTNAIWSSCEGRRSEVESGHYSTLDTHDCNGVMIGIYDIIEDPKYLTVCTTSPAATKLEHELKAKEMAEMEAAKRKTMMHASIAETQLMKASTNEVY